MERKGIIAAGNMLVDHVHQIIQWPERGWLAEITHSERSTGGAPLNVLLPLAKMRAGLPLQAVGLIGQDSDGDYIMAMLEQYHVNRQHVQRTTFAPTSMPRVGSSRSRTSGCVSSQRPRMTFCWLPPERFLMSVFCDGVLMCMEEKDQSV